MIINQDTHKQNSEEIQSHNYSPTDEQISVNDAYYSQEFIEQVLDFLKQNPSFLENHPELVGELNFQHPTGDNIISLTERQLITLREKKLLLEHKLKELIQYGEENDLLNEKLHQFCLVLLSTKDILVFEEVVCSTLKEYFHIDEIGLVFWGSSVPSEIQAYYNPQIQATVAAFTHRLRGAYCSKELGFNPRFIFPENSEILNSFACVPLMHDVPCGLLILASFNKEHFHEEMDTLFITKLGELITEAWLRLCHNYNN